MTAISSISVEVLKVVWLVRLKSLINLDLVT